MREEKTMASMARIEVQQHFCNNCSACIKERLQDLDDVDNIRLYPKDSLITFNFMKANRLSDALNVLSNIGYPEKGERICKERFSKSLCRC